MAATSMVHVRVDENVKAQAAETLATMGLSISDAVRVLLVRVAAEFAGSHLVLVGDSAIEVN